MDYKQYIDKRIENLKASNLAFKRLSVVLLVIGAGLVLLPLLELIPTDVANDYAQYGFGLINILVPVYLQGLISKRKAKILDLELVKSNLSDSSIEESVMERVLEKL